MSTVPYDRLGGEAGIERLIARLYDRVLEDPELAPFFASASIDKLQRMQREFIGAALGGPQAYSGLSLSWVHANRGITTANFNRFAQHLMTAMEELSIGPDDMQGIIHRISVHKNDITGEAY